MKLIRFLLAALIVFLAFFHLSTCSYGKCESGAEISIADIRLQSGQLHNTNTHLKGRVNSTISFPGFRIYYLNDGTDQPLMVKVAIGSGVPTRGTLLSVCAIVHEVININGSVKWVVIEEIIRTEIRSDATLNIEQ